jgi:putative exosortase-associated protein (TIGR04073 family)
MAKKSSVVFSLLAACAFLVGCAGPEQKLGRGISNSAEPFRLGELRRSIEQTAIFGSPDQSRTVGIIHGFDRTVARTGVGLYEIVTFPIPNHPMGDYSAIFRPVDPVYPDSYKPNWGITSTLQPNASLDFSGGDVAPLIPGSRFRIFDN